MIECEGKSPPLAHQLDVRSIVTCFECRKIRLGKEGNRNRVPHEIAGWFGIHADQSQVGCHKTRLFECLASAGIFHRFVHVNKAAGQRIEAFERLVAALDKHNALAMKDDAVHGNRPRGKIQYHVSGANEIRCRRMIHTFCIRWYCLPFRGIRTFRIIKVENRNSNLSLSFLMSRFRQNFLLLNVLIVLMVGCRAAETQQPAPPIELRGVWLTDTTVFSSREKIAEAMQFLAEHHFNAVFPVVWNGGKTLHPSKVMHEWFGMPHQPQRDPLAELIKEAHQRNIAVIPTFGLGLATTPAEDEWVVKKKPQWAARDRNGATVKKDGIEWLNPLHPEVQEFLLSLVSEVAKTYNVDGVQGGDRLLAEPIEAGYDSVTTALFQETHAGNKPPQDVHETHWKYWRAVRINAVVQKLYWRAKAFKARFVMMWAPLPYRTALNGYLHDWRTWIHENPYGEFYADAISPQIRVADLEMYKQTLDAQHKDTLKIKQKNRYQFPALVLKDGDRSIPEEALTEAIRYNRVKGYNGEVIFSYELLRQNNGALAAALKRTFYSRPARLPFSTAGLQAQ